MERREEEEAYEPESRRMSGLMMAVLGGIIISAFVLLVLLLVSESYMTMPAKCLPLEDPKLAEKVGDSTRQCFEKDTNLRVDRDKPSEEKDQACDEMTPNEYRASVRVQVITDRTGYGKTVLVPETTIYDSAFERWHINGTKQMAWAMTYCLCPGCNGIHPGVCEECTPRTPGCDVEPPEFDCWVRIRRSEAGFPIFNIGVTKVRFEKFRAERNDAFLISLIFFIVLFGLLLIAGFFLGLPAKLFGNSDKSYTP
ncbi:hypothetical protein GUITHDRAFT_163544, partial [Guillardia theta CCMP2712]